jgi:hypothetical protein
MGKLGNKHDKPMNHTSTSSINPNDMTTRMTVDSLVLRCLVFLVKPLFVTRKFIEHGQNLFMQHQDVV